MAELCSRRSIPCGTRRAYRRPIGRGPSAYAVVARGGERRPHALVRPRRRRRLLRPGPRQPGPVAAHRRALPPRAGLPARAGAAGPSCPARPSRCWSATSSTPGRRSGSPAHRPTRRHRAALRHQHRLAVRLRLPGHAAGQARRAGRRAPPTRPAWPGRPGSSPASARGLIELGGALVAERIRRATPRAALLSTLAGIALGFISLGFLLRAFARPSSASPRWAWCSSPTSARSGSAAACPGGLVAVLLGTVPRLGHRASRRWARPRPRRRPGPPRSRSWARSGRRSRRPPRHLPLGDPAHGALHAGGLAAERRVGRGRRRRLPHPSVTHGEWPLHGGGGLPGLLLPHHPLHRPPGLEGAGGPGRLLGA